MNARERRVAEERVLEWVGSIAEHTKPYTMHRCDGTEAEASRLEAAIRSEDFLAKFGDRLPEALRTEQRELVQRLAATLR